ncbi:hypothetical protein J19TS2_43760 [Cohnella xylanilytica]|nr:hypothetical protein J19TS2_43760 [Cohnella xylanilytica]
MYRARGVQPCSGTAGVPFAGLAAEPGDIGASSFPNGLAIINEAVRLRCASRPPMRVCVC